MNTIAYVDVQVCTAAVGLVGDLCRSLNDKILPHTDELMQNLIEILAVCEFIVFLLFLLHIIAFS